MIGKAYSLTQSQLRFRNLKMSLVSLDVRGKLFKTSVETLRKFPASRLAEIVSSANNNLQDVISLDVNPEYFSLVIDWLRYT